MPCLTCHPPNVRYLDVEVFSEQTLRSQTWPHGCLIEPRSQLVTAHTAQGSAGKLLTAGNFALCCPRPWEPPGSAQVNSTFNMKKNQSVSVWAEMDPDHSGMRQASGLKGHNCSSVRTAQPMLRHQLMPGDNSQLQLSDPVRPQGQREGTGKFLAL